MSVVKRTFGSKLYKVTWQVDKKHDGLRLDQFVQTRLRGFSREQIKKKIAHNEIQICGRPVKARPKTRVCLDDQISLQIQNTTHEDEWWNGKKLQLDTTPDVLYEDDELIAVSKPPYMSVHPTGKHLFNCVTVYFENSCRQSVHSVHRLDRETSGILLLAKKPQAAAALTHCFETNKIQKCYFFISATNQRYSGEQEFSVLNRIAPCERFGPKRVIMNLFPPDSTNGKKAITRFNILEQKNRYALGLAFPLTGRQHQIRVHAMSKGLPLLGDKLYGGSFEMFQRFKDNWATPEDHRAMELSRHALHALAIKFPYKNQNKALFCPLPKDLQKWLQTTYKIEPEQLQTWLKEKVESYFSLPS